MKTSWKTSLAGILAGASLAINAVVEAINAGALEGKTGLQLVGALALIILGVWAKDSNVTGGTKPNTNP